MSIALLAPLGLAALAALVVPLVIHLVRRLELKTTEFAALRWISERTRPQRRLRFERPWLLLLRLALLTVLALLLARPVWQGEAISTRPWVVVAPGVALADARAAAGAVDAEWHWLAPRFPHADETVAVTDIPIASLLRELDAQLPANAALTVVVPEQLAGLDGERPRLSRAVDWRIVPGRMVETAPPSTDRIRVAVRYASDAEASLRYLRAAVAAWNQGEPGRYELDERPADAPIDAATNWLVWLAPSAPELTRWLDHGGVALVSSAAAADGEPLWRDAAGRMLAKVAIRGNGRVIALPGALTPAELPLLLDADFPDRLRAAFGGESLAPTRATAAAMHPRVEAAMATGAARSPASAHPLDAWLALLIAALFLCERFIATRPRAESEA
ncbi:BatA domain-containing protein [Rudaea sp.]|uniref:BatA domain-containing protein n=1 Tax=Rudaea sp. TaxID=2136325 RepID=UPI002ED4A808